MLNLTTKKKWNLLEIFNLSEIAKTERKRKKHGLYSLVQMLHSVESDTNKQEQWNFFIRDKY